MTSTKSERRARKNHASRDLDGKVLFALGSIIAVLQSSVVARADETGVRSPEPLENAKDSDPTAAADPPSAAELRSELGVYAEQGRRERVVTNVTTLVAGAALVPTGLLLAYRHEPLAKSLGVGMTLGGSIPLAFLFATILPSRMERLRDDFDARRAAGVPDSELVPLLEAKWADAARGGHNRRVVVGIIDLSLGAAALGAGTYFLLSNPVGKMDRNDQYTLGYALAGTGLPLTAFGVRSLVQKSLEETSWDAHRAAHRGSRSAGATLTAPSVAVVPLPGGAGAFASFSF
jgi:hypothetical protein